VRIRGARPDVEAAFPNAPSVDWAGWGLLVMTNMLPNHGNGTYRLHAIAEDATGQKTVLGIRTIIVDNATSQKPFGTIDTPGQGETIRGSGYVNFGWALTPPPKTIASDGSTIVVFIDGQAVGTVSYNHFRQDIADLFPNYLNATGAIGHRTLDTTTLTDGMHTISWAATDNAGVTEGLGSRYFWVNNGSTSTAPASRAMRTPPTGTIEAGSSGRPPAVLEELGRIELRVPDSGAAPSCGATPYEAFQEVMGTPRALPVGATFDAEHGTFVWQPGPGFVGRYRMVFVREGCDGSAVRVTQDIIVLRKHQRPVGGDVGSPDGH
jgi:hypothetical protein